MVEYVGQSEPIALDHGTTMTKSQWRIADGSIVEIEQLAPGAMWMDEDKGLCVMLPGKRIWYPDRPDRTWKREGTLPNITVTPSVNAVGVYHGFLQNGVLTSDCEGRTFADEPR